MGVAEIVGVFEAVGNGAIKPDMSQLDTGQNLRKQFSR
jgi:hypothetical protein